MRKDNGDLTSILIAAGIITLIMLFIYFGGSALKPASFINTPTPIASGLTVDSISLQNEPPVQGQPNKWIVSAHVSGFGQSISYYVQNLVDKNNAGITSTSPLSISGSITKNEGFYPIDSDPQKITNIYKYTFNSKIGTYNSYGYGLYSTITPPSDCDSGWVYRIPGYTTSGVFGISSSTLVSYTCIYRNHVATVSPISSSPNVVPQITLNVNGQQVILNSLGAVPLNIGTGSGITWSNNPYQAGSAGILSIGQQYSALQIDRSTNYRVIYTNEIAGQVGQGFITTDTLVQSNFQSLSSTSTQNPISACTISTYSNDPQGDINRYATCMLNYVTNYNGNTNQQNSASSQTLNNLVNAMLTENTKINLQGSTYTNYNTYTSNGQAQKGFVVDLGSIMGANPQLQLILDTAGVGVVFPNGIPQVISATSNPNPFNSGQPVSITVKVKNIGTGIGNFNIQGLSGGLQQSSQIYPYPNIQPGQTIDIVFTMLTSGTSSSSGAITGNVVDTGSFKSSPFTVNYNMVSAPQCQVGRTYSYGGSTIQGCKLINNVPTLYDLQTCQYGVSGDGNGGWLCAVNPMPTSTSQSGSLPTPMSTNGNGAGIGNNLNWYDTPQAVLLFFLIIALAFVGYIKYKKE